MAYLYLNDGGPEASEYSTNYFEFNESDPCVQIRLLHALHGKKDTDPGVRSRVESICKSSYSIKYTKNMKPHLLGWSKRVSKN